MNKKIFLLFFFCTLFLNVISQVNHTCQIEGSANPLPSKETGHHAIIQRKTCDEMLFL